MQLRDFFGIIIVQSDLCYRKRKDAISAIIHQNQWKDVSLWVNSQPQN